MTLDLSFYDLDAEEIYGERVVLYDRETGEPYVLNPAGNRVYINED